MKPSAKAAQQILGHLQMAPINCLEPDHTRCIEKLVQQALSDSLRPYRELLATMRGRQTELLKPQYMMKTEELGKFQSLIYEWCADELEAILKEAGK